MPGVVVHSVYKPPNDQFELSALGHRNLPHIVIGDFNSHSTTWGYNTTDDNEEAVEEWADSCDFTLIHGPRCETTEIIQQCGMEEKLQPGPHICICMHHQFV